MENKNLLLEVRNYSWNQLYKMYNKTVEFEDLENLHFEIEQTLVDAKKVDVSILQIKYFTDRIRFYYVQNNKSQFVELSLYGFASNVTNQLYYDGGIWRHSDHCLYY